MDDDALAYVAITRLQGRYADIATRQAWDEMVDIVFGDATFTFDLGNVVCSSSPAPTFPASGHGQRRSSPSTNTYL